MNAKVKLLFNDSIKNIEFQNEMIIADSEDAEYFNRSATYYYLMHDLKKTIIAMTYYGWLLGKGIDTTKYTKL